MKGIPVRIGAVALIAVSVIVAAGCGSAQRTPAEHVQRAKDLHEQGDLRTAVIELKNAVQADPQNAEARWLLGNVYVDLADGVAAEKELRRAAELGVSPEAVRVPLSKALLLQAKFDEVLREMPPATGASTKQVARVQAVRAEALMGLGRVQEGCADFKQVQQADPSYIPAYWHLARCAVGEKDLDQAQAHLQKALELDGENFRTWDFMGDLARLRRDWPAATDAFEKALEIRPDVVRPRLRFASVHLAAGKLPEARKQVERALELNSRDPMAKYMKGLVEFREGDLKQARETLQEVVSAVPNNPQALFLFGVVNHGLGYYEQAVSNLINVVNRYPANSYARKLLAASLIRVDLPDQAAKTLAPLLTATDQDPQLLALQSEIHMRRGDNEKAAQYLEQAAELDPDSALAHLNLGMGLLRAGDTDKALAELKTAAELGADQNRAEFLIVRTLLSRQQYDQAIETIEELEEKIPESGALYNLKAGAYLSKGEEATARKYLEKAMSVESPSVGAALNLAQLDLKGGDAAAARQRYETVLSWDETNLKALLALARLAAMERNDQEFRRWATRAMEAHPDAAAPRQLLARHHLRSGEPEKALRLARETHQRDPDDPGAVDLLGQVQLAMGEAHNAVGTFRRLTQLRPDSALAHYRVGTAELAAGNAAAAAAAFREALTIKPNYMEAQSVLALLTAKQGNPDAALRIAKQMQEQHPGSPRGFMVEGDVQLAQRRFQDAVKAFERALAVEQNGPALIGLHRALLGAGDEAAADRRLLQWLESRGDDYAVRNELAQSYLLRGKRQEAAQQYEALLNTSPDDVRALNNLAWLYHYEKDERALPLARKAHQLAPENPATQDTLGWLLVESGDIRQGVELLQQAAQKAPPASEAHYHYAAALAKAGDTERARRQLEEMLAGKQKHAWSGQAQALLEQLRN